MIINEINGNLTFEKILITPATTYTELRTDFPDNRIWEVGNGYVWIYFSDIVIDDKTFSVAVCFNGEKLHFVDFSFRFKGEKIITDWSEWTEKYELSQKKKLDQWLTAQIGKNRQFSWGSIEAYYSPKSSTSGILVNYIK